MAAEWTPHSCEICINLDPIKVETPMSCSKKKTVFDCDFCRIMINSN